ncbi:Pao retrotransposon peptidase family protein, partial [Aphelenchoides avenae]
MHLSNSGAEYAEEYARNMYSDNVFLFANSEEEALKKYTEIKRIFTEMQMNIREFIANTETVTAKIPEEDQAKETKAKTLGLDWTPSDSVADYWTLRMPNPRVVPTCTDTTKAPKRIPKKKRRDKYTKRFVISVIHKLFDPLNQLCPVTLQARLVYQETWQDKSLKWDDELPEELIQRWLKVTESWNKVTETKIPRYIFRDVKGPFTAELHIFTDASQDGCCAAFYLLMKSSCGKVFCRLLFGKNYVKKDKPKPLTIPRMELVAVLIGCRSLTFLRKEVVPEILKVTGQSELPTTLWCDNQ